MTWPAPCLDTGQTGHQLRIIGGPPSNFARFDFVGCPTPYSAEAGSTVRGKTLYRIESREIGVDIPGETITNIRARPRTIVCPIVVHADQETTLEDAWDTLGGFLSTIEGPCRLIWTRADGGKREITAHYQSGADTVRITNLHQHRHIEANLTFRASYPYWTEFGGTVQDFGGGFNNALGAGITMITFDNQGDVRTWPTVTLNGPVERVELMNQSTGQLVRVNEIITAGQQIRLEFDPRNRGVFLDDVWQPSVLDPTAADMWPLLPGVNNVILRAVSPGDAGLWEARWPILWEGP